MEQLNEIIEKHSELISQIEKLEDEKYLLADKIFEDTKMLDKGELLRLLAKIKESDLKFKLYQRIKAIKGYFELNGTDGDLKLYKTKDEEYSLTVRPDGFFVLYKLNKKDDAYDWVETYFHSFEECEAYMDKKGYVLA
jgi:hypothetical protein